MYRQYSRSQLRSLVLNKIALLILSQYVENYCDFVRFVHSKCARIGRFVIVSTVCIAYTICFMCPLEVKI